jgi:hypothetical protein
MYLNKIQKKITLEYKNSPIFKFIVVFIFISILMAVFVVPIIRSFGRWQLKQNTKLEQRAL